jgi:membrane-associated phospholipid phosphatase
LTHGLKYAVDAERPNGGGRSFPSGHASISFCSAEFLRRRYGWAWGVPAYAAACFVGYSRVEVKQHYTRDVVAGALIGFAGSHLFARSYGGVSVEASAGAGECGLTVVCTW